MFSDLFGHCGEYLWEKFLHLIGCFTKKFAGPILKTSKAPAAFGRRGFLCLSPKRCLEAIYPNLRMGLLAVMRNVRRFATIKRLNQPQEQNFGAISNLAPPQHV
jgi:hypothetical protein